RVRKESPEASFVNVGDLLGIMWTNLAKTEKAVYVKMARNDAERYEKKLCCDRTTAAYKPTRQSRISYHIIR
ncbi:hypothetical protein DL89DRAFT_230818, partial [Linderina pennispora]